MLTKDELEEQIEELEKHKGRHTELITVYVSEGYDVNSVQKQLEAEKSTAKNIKSTSTRKNVTDALDKIVRHLKEFKKTPENGLAIFCGNVSKVEGQDDLQLWSIEPPLPLKIRLYRCDKEFVLEPLKDQMEVDEIFALLVMDRKEATIGVLEGKRIEVLQKMTSGIPSKVRAGGQCHIPGTMVQLFNGEVRKIEDVEKGLQVKSLNFKNFNLKDSEVLNKWKVKKNKIYQIKTIFPQLFLESSGDHIFLVKTDKGIIEKIAKELKKGDLLLMPEKISIKGVDSKIDSKKYYNSFKISEEGRIFLKKKRIKSGLSQKKLAKLMNSVQTVVSYYEIGRQNARSSFLKRLCTLLDIDFSYFVNKYTLPLHYKGTEVKLPKELDTKFAQFLGYYIGDGGIEKDRITFFEQRKDVCLEYKKIYDNYFNINSSYKFREKKNYHQLRFTSRPLVNLIKSEFPKIKKTLDTEIPVNIFRSKDEIVASFLRGLFDAEGYVVRDSVGIALANKTLIKQIFFLLLRFSIITSFQEYDNKKNPYSNKPIFKLQINEKESLRKFSELIGFTAFDKMKKLFNLIEEKTDKSSVRQILPFGTEVAKIIKDSGYSLRKFPKVSSFFRNKRMMSKVVFEKSILNLVDDEKLYSKLKKIHQLSIVPVKISNILIKEKEVEMIDIETKNHNFVANGLVVHNSSQRFHRITEGLTRDFYKRIAEEMKKCFFENPKLKGILIGGPIPTKDEFVDNEYLTNQLQEKIIGRVDIGGSDESGLKELVEKSQDILENQEIIKEKQLLEKFFETLGEKPELAAYKEKDVKKALEYGAVDILLLTKKYEKVMVKALRKIAVSTGTKVEVISTETEEGKQFDNLSGIGAILRFQVH